MKNLQDLARRITVRPADPADSVEAAQLIFITGEAMFKYAFYSDINKTIDLIGNLFQMEGNDLTYKCTYIAEIDGQVGGMIHFADKQCWANNKREMGPKILGQMGTLQTLARIPRFFHLQQLIRKIDESAIYIKHLATREVFRRRGLAKRLLAFCEQHAPKRVLCSWRWMLKSPSNKP